jgi:sec-independent protein translocase protein TatA
MGFDSPSHWAILAVIVIALFGYKKLPDAARSLGRSLRIFKTEIKGMGEDDAARNAAKETPALPAPPTNPVPPPAAPIPPPAEAVTGDKPSVAANTETPEASV